MTRREFLLSTVHRQFCRNRWCTKSKGSGGFVCTFNIAILKIKLQIVKREFFRFALAFFGRGVPTHRIKAWCKRLCCATVSRLIGHSLTLQFKLNSRVYIQSVSRYRSSSDVVWRNLVTHDRLTWPRCLSNVARLNACSQHRNRTELQSDVQSPQHIDAVVAYLRRLIQDRQHSHNLRLATTTQPSTTTTFAKCTYRCSAPAVWNSLPKLSLIATLLLRLSLR